MTFKEKIADLKTQSDKLIALNAEMETAKKKFKADFLEALGIDTEKPIDLLAILAAFEKVAN